MTQSVAETSSGFYGVTDAVIAGDRTLALNRAMGALREGAGHPQVLRQLLDGLRREGRTSIKGEDLPDVLARLGGLIARQGQLDCALGVLEASLALDPDNVGALRDAATTSFMLSDLDRAGDYYDRAVALSPDDGEALAGLAAVRARQLRAGDARDAGLRALAVDPQSVTAHLAVARADFMDGGAAAAVARLNPLLARGNLSDQNRIAIHDLRADALDALDRPAEAFADYAARNVLVERASAALVRAEVRERRVDQARRLADHFETRASPAWGVAAPVDVTARPNPVFLLGFPRTGTTLLEKALAGHPDVTTIEEVELFGPEHDAMLADDAALARLVAMPDAQLEQLRTRYWAAVDQATNGATRPVVVDKMPLNTVRLPLIARLFPDAKILFAIRDPRDVVLSCFRRRFRTNAAMYEFLTLAGAAAYYDAVMRMAQASRAVLPLAVHDISHEALIADFDGVVGNALGFLGLDWDDSVRDFGARAGVRFKTPSDVQLTRGLTSAGVGQWRRYAGALEPVAATLAPWVEQFGYGEIERP